ncbi:MAG: FG-GAP repeat protein [Planctomycetes bacterium]|nr:FG-GAP repeat protein [Planctomycetota bacterium]
MSRLLTLTAVLAASSGSLLSSQMKLDALAGPAAGAQFGATTAAAGDLDHDGYPDFLVGAPGASPNGLLHAGRVYVVSGRTRAVLGAHDGTVAGAHHGAALAGGVDVNKDGWPDFLVGAPDETGGGAARLVSGIDLTTLFTFTGGNLNGTFGSAVAFTGDTNFDTFVDMAVGDPTHGLNGPVGQVRNFSGLNGSLISIWSSSAPEGRFGSALATVGDWNGDLRPDLAVGLPGYGAGLGRVEVRSASNSAVLAFRDGSPFDDQFGRTLATLGDVDGDAHGDLLVGAFEDGAPSGRATVLRWGTLSEWFTLIGPSNYGASLASVGDVDRDGRDDFVVGAPTVGGGYAFVSSGLTSGLLWTNMSKPGSDGYGSSVAGLGDVDGDGWLELAVGASGTDLAGTDAGHVDVWRAAVAQPSAGFGGPGDTLMEVYGMPLSSGSTADLLVSDAPVNRPTYLLLSTSQDPLAFRGGVIVPDLATAITFSFGTGPTGSFQIAGIPGGNGPGHVFMQLLTVDPTLPLGVDFSNAVDCVFLP